MSDEPSSRFVSYIPDKLYDLADQSDLSERTKIVSELAVRLLDLREVERSAPRRLMDTLLRVYRVDPETMWIVVKILAGNRLAGVSLSDMAKEETCSKQNIHQTQQRNIEKVRQVLPEISETLCTILGRKERPKKE